MWIEDAQMTHINTCDQTKRKKLNKTHARHTEKGGKFCDIVIIYLTRYSHTCNRTYENIYKHTNNKYPKNIHLRQYLYLYGCMYEYYVCICLWVNRIIQSFSLTHWKPSNDYVCFFFVVAWWNMFEYPVVLKVTM